MKLVWKDFHDYFYYSDKRIIKQFLINKDFNRDGFTTKGRNNQNVDDDYVWNEWVLGNKKT